MGLQFVPQRVIPLPNLTLSKTIRRLNLSEMDRAKLYYWNAACILLTALPIAHLLTYNHHYSKESESLVKQLRQKKSHVGSHIRFHRFFKPAFRWQ